MGRKPILLATAPKGRKDVDEEVHSATQDLPARNAELFERLRTLRKQIANERELPPYIIFQDNVLKQMAALLPLTSSALLQLSGVGEKKAEDLGPRFTGAIREFVNDNPDITPVGLTRTASAPAKSTSDTALASVKLFQKGVSLYEIAKERGLTQTTVANHLEEGIKNGEITDIARLVPPHLIDRIRNAFAATGSVFLKPVLNHLNDVTITYDHLKFVRAYDERSGS